MVEIVARAHDSGLVGVVIARHQHQVTRHLAEFPSGQQVIKAVTLLRAEDRHTGVVARSLNTNVHRELRDNLLEVLDEDIEAAIQVVQSNFYSLKEDIGLWINVLFCMVDVGTTAVEKSRDCSDDTWSIQA